MPLDDKSLITLLRMQFAIPAGFRISDHARRRGAKRNISVSDMRNCVLSGQIIERQNFGWDPHIVIRGQKLDNTEMHLVVALAEEASIVVTVYNPDEDEWEVYKGKIRRK